MFLTPFGWQTSTGEILGRLEREATGPKQTLQETSRWKTASASSPSILGAFRFPLSRSRPAHLLGRQLPLVGDGPRTEAAHVKALRVRDRQHRDGVGLLGGRLDKTRETTCERGRGTNQSLSSMTQAYRKGKEALALTKRAHDSYAPLPFCCTRPQWSKSAPTLPSSRHFCSASLSRRTQDTEHALGDKRTGQQTQSPQRRLSKLCRTFRTR